nr:HMG-Y-related protein A-like [Ipomoea batatas]
MASERVNKPPSHPEYPEMIIEAIDALKQEEGSNKTSISRYIESKYGELPSAHSKLLTFHLDRMKQSGELIFLKNNYIKAGPGVPPKRGRGRKPKPSPGPSTVTLSKTGRPRGRPRKVKPQPSQPQNGLEMS